MHEYVGKDQGETEGREMEVARTVGGGRRD